MKHYPLLEIKQSSLIYNLNHLTDLLHSQGRTLAVVIKAFCANQEIFERVVAKSDIDYIASSRVPDFKLDYVQKTKFKKFLIRSSMACEIEDIVRYTTLSFESSIETLKLLEMEAKKQGVIHEVAIAIDLGDLREGIFYQYEQEIYDTIDFALSCNHLLFKGIGTNLGCLNRVKTDNKNMDVFVQVIKKIEDHYNRKIDFVTGINTSGMPLILDNTLPKEITNARIGEAWLLGTDNVDSMILDGFKQDAFVFKAQIIEIKEKPSLPIGEIGKAFAHYVKDDGVIKRAIVACGNQEIDSTALFPMDSGIELIGSSSDHTVLDITHAKENYKIGDIISFRIKYKSLLRIYSGTYVTKSFIEE